MWVSWPDYLPSSQFAHGIPQLTEAHTKGGQRLWAVPTDFLQALRQSSFFFARKWSDAQGYDTIVNSDMTLTEAFQKYILV
jgi:hypothetical protein